jgi:tetratricopeptide (TPR) repeat protein
MKKTIYILLLLTFLPVFGQQKTDSVQVNKLIKKGLSAYDRAKYEQADLQYRKALSIDPLNATATYDLGMTSIEKNAEGEAAYNFKKSAQSASDKNFKSKAYFNEGNVWFHKKKYEKAIESYKNALRNNPGDEQARYNLALAQMMLKKQQKNNKNKKNKNKNKNKNQNKNQDKNKDKNKDKNQKNKDQNKKNQNQKDQNKNKKDDKNKQNQNKEGKDKKKEQNKQNQNKQNQDKGDKKDLKNKAGKQGEKRKVKLTPQQVKQLLIALKNKEQKTQKKVKAKILKGKAKKKKQEKDW